jgi:opacity protein-like surface antigen
MPGFRSASATVALALIGLVCAGAMPATAQQPGGWSGFYFGGYVGAAQGSAKSSGSKTDSHETFELNEGDEGTFAISTILNFHDSGDGTGTVADLFVGYNALIAPRALLGVQLEGSVFSDLLFVTTTLATGTRRETLVSNGKLIEEFVSAASETVDVRDRLTSTVSGILRAGFLVTPDVLVYALGGASIGNFQPASAFGSKSQWVLGYTAGGGLEAKLNANWSIRAEYRYLVFDGVDQNSTSSFSETTSCGIVCEETVTNTIGFHSSSDYEIHMGKVGVIYRLN